MNTLIVFILALALSMDCFAIAIVNSNTGEQGRNGAALKAAIMFAAGHFLLLLAGYWIGGFFVQAFANVKAWVVLFIFFLIAVKMIRDGVRNHPQSRAFDIQNIRVVFALALAGSMDALLVGIALGLTEARAMQAATFVAIAVFLFTFSGLTGGKQLGLSFARRTAIFGGVFMIIAAGYFLSQVISS